MTHPACISGTAVALAFVLLFLQVGLARAELIPCSKGGIRDANCPVDSETPYCAQYGLRMYACFACYPGSTIYGGGSCMCNANTSYCESDEAGYGNCKLYTILDKACSSDSDCKTTGNTIVQSNVPAQTLYCVNNKCKPCSPTLWAQNTNGAVAGVYTCAGFSSAGSDAAGTYKTNTGKPGTSFGCAADGSIIMINDVVNYDYQFPGGSRNNWGPSSTFAATNGQAISGSTTSKSTTSAAAATNSGGQSTTITNGAAGPAATTGNGNTPVSSQDTITDSTTSAASTAAKSSTTAARATATTASSTTDSRSTANAEDSGAVSIVLSRATVYVVAVVAGLAVIN